MPYEIALENDFDRGLDRYTVTLGPDFDSAAAQRLCDWLAAAAQNPTAVFTIDVADAPRARPVATVLARCAWLRTRRRLDVVRRGLAVRSVPVALGVADGVLPPF
jgi:hypothetical protein